MKRGKLALLAMFIILILPLVSATITIEGPEKDEYNIGDTLEISGSILEGDSVEGFISTKLVCGEEDFPLRLVPIEILAEQKVLFPDEVQLPEIIIPANMIGDCKVKVLLLEGLTEVDSAESSMFKVIKDLKGTFSLQEDKIQVGRSIVLNGQVLQQDMDDVNGMAEIYFKYNQTKYLIDVIDVEDGILYHEYQTTPTPAGVYYVDVFVRDTYGNEQLFEDVANFLLVRDLRISASSNKREYSPGESVLVSGDVKDVLSYPIKEAEAEIKIGGLSVKTEVKDGLFKTDFNLPGDIKSGKTALLITIKDSYGNVGSYDFDIEIESVASRLENELTSTEVGPEDSLELKIGLYDQANDELKEEVLVEVMDTESKLRLSKVVDSNKKISFVIPTFAKPGKWYIKSSVGELVDEDYFTVLELKRLDVNIVEDIISIRNTGNVKYKDDVVVSLNKGIDKYEIKSKKDIQPNETIMIYLKEELPSGTYEATIPLPDGEVETWQNIIVEGGKPEKSFNGIYLLMLFALVVFIIYLTLVKSKKKGGYKPPKKKKKLANVHKKVEERFKAEEEKKKNVKDFRDRILEEIKRTERKAENLFHSKKGEMSIPKIETPKPVEKPEEKKEDKPKEGGFLSLFG